MNPELPQKPQDELEASLTALLLGELPHEQAAALHQKLAQDAELAKLYERLKLTINLVRETISSPAAETAAQPAPLKLAEERRQKLLQHFKTVAPKEFVQPRRRWRPTLVEVGIAAALVLLLASIAVPNFLKVSTSSMRRFQLMSSVSKQAEFAAPAPPVAGSTKYYPDLNRNERLAPEGETRRARTSDAKPLEMAPPPAKSAGTAIILPSATEVAGVPQTPAVSEGVQAGFEVSGTTRDFYDDSVDRAGGVGGSGAFGGFRGRAQNYAPATEGRPAGTVTAGDFFAEPEALGSLEAPKAVAGELDNMHSKQGNVGLADGSVHSAFVGRYGYIAPPSTANGTVEAPAPAVVPPSLPAGTPAEVKLGEVAQKYYVPSSASTLAATAPAEGSEVAKVPLQTRAAGMTAGDLVAGDRALAPGQQSEVLNRGEVLQQREVAWSDTSEKAPDTPFVGGSLNTSANLKAAKEVQKGVPMAGVAAAGKPASQVESFGLAITPTQTEAAGEVAGRSVNTSDFSVTTSGTESLNYQWHFDATAQPGLANSDGDKAPMLGDVPALGRFYRVKPAADGGGKAYFGSAITPLPGGKQAGDAAASAGNALVLGPQGGPDQSKLGLDLYDRQSPAPNAVISQRGVRQFSFDRATAQDDERIAAGAIRPLTKEKVKSVELAYKEGLEREKRRSESEKAGGQNLREDFSTLNVVGYVNATLPSTNFVAGFPGGRSRVERYGLSGQPVQLGVEFNGVSRAARSPIVLPPAPAETGLALKDNSGKDVQLLASVSQLVADPAAPEATRKQGAEDAAKTQPYFEAKRQLEELQRSRQILDTKIASEKTDVELPKTTMVEIVDKAVPATSPSSTLWAKIRGKADDYKSTARVKVERDQSDISGMKDRGGTASYDPYFIQSEAELIQSEAVLGKVVEDFDLKEAWAGKKGAGDKLTTAEAVTLLKQSLDLRPVKNTSLLEIGVKSDKPEEAAKIANAVAEEYKARRLAQRAELSKAGTKALEERYAEQEQKVQEAQKKVDDLRAKLQVSDGATHTQPADAAPPKPAAPAPIPQPEVQTADNAWSTFSLNVSDVAFKLAGASLEKGVMPEPATVRSEEFINAFDYRDPEPPPGVPVAFTWERTQYPFAQNRELLRFSIKTAALGRQPGRPLNLVLLLDNSGSMERADRVRIIREALRVLAGQLQPQDKLSVVTFSRTAHLWVDGVPGNQAAQVAEAVGGLTPQGGTNLEDAMNLAYQTALQHYLANGVNRVVLLTDGAANLGNVEPEALKQKVEAHRKQGVALDCFGIGWEGYNDDLLEVLSRNGDGRYGFVNTPEEAATEFAGQLAGALRVAASDVKVQVEFNPGRVTAYRQIGYAKHQLTKEQFRDNTVDAAEIAAQEAGNALYVVEVNPRGDGPLGMVRVRYKVPGTTDYHEHEWAVPYTGNAVALEQASPAMRLAATASAFAEWLVSSPYAGEVTPNRLLGYLSGVPEVYGADGRPKKLEWMIRQATSIAGK